MAKLVKFDMGQQFHVLRGHDKYKQSVVIKYPRTKGDTTQESYVTAQLYMAERSVAATEFSSRSLRERSVAVYNYVGFDRSKSPAFPMQVAAATQLQTMYPERLETLVFVEPPFWLKGILQLLSPFLSDTITKRILWATGRDEREATFGKLLDNDDDATILFRKNGKLTSPVSLDHFLIDVPFFAVYDSVPCKRECTEEEIKLDSLAHQDPQKVESLANQASSLWGSLNSSLVSSFGGGTSSSEEETATK
jgi:hypothetical protein